MMKKMSSQSMTSDRTATTLKKGFERSMSTLSFFDARFWYHQYPNHTEKMTPRSRQPQKSMLRQAPVRLPIGATATATTPNTTAKMAT